MSPCDRFGCSIRLGFKLLKVAASECLTWLKVKHVQIRRILIALTAAISHMFRDCKVAQLYHPEFEVETIRCREQGDSDEHFAGAEQS